MSAGLLPVSPPNAGRAVAAVGRAAAAAAAAGPGAAAVGAASGSESATNDDIEVTRSEKSCTAPLRLVASASIRLDVSAAGDDATAAVERGIEGGDAPSAAWCRVVAPPVELDRRPGLVGAGGEPPVVTSGGAGTASTGARRRRAALLRERRLEPPHARPLALELRAERRVLLVAQLQQRAHARGELLLLALEALEEVRREEVGHVEAQQHEAAQAPFEDVRNQAFRHGAAARCENCATARRISTGRRLARHPPLRSSTPRDHST